MKRTFPPEKQYNIILEVHDVNINKLWKLQKCDDPFGVLLERVPYLDLILRDDALNVIENLKTVELKTTKVHFEKNILLPVYLRMFSTYYGV